MAGTRPTTAGSDVAAAVRRGALPLLAGLGAALALHFGFSPAAEGLFGAGAYFGKIALDVMIAVILAVSLTMVNGFTGQFSIGHAGFMALGGYTAAAITYYGSIRIFGDAQPRGGVLSWAYELSGFTGGLFGAGELLFLAACLAGGIVAAGAGYIVGLPSLRLRGDYLAIVTLGFGEIVRVILQASGDQVTGADAVRTAALADLPTRLGGAVGFNFIPTYTTLFWATGWAAITILVAVRLKDSSYGRAFLSIREDEIAAEAMGIHTTRYKVRAFVLSAFFAGVAGALFAHQIGSVNAGELGFIKSFDIIIIIVLGGLGSISGAVLAAAVLTILPEALREAAQYRMVVFALLLIVMMIVRPQGIFGTHELWDIIARRRRARAAGAGADAGGAP